ncbi:primosomal protein, partial [Cryobacterium lyxosi]|uniref:primosomal protein n=1 Tax=Cryobacterium lyxosi TaxID=1259228 RepID=UPI001F543F13
GNSDRPSGGSERPPYRGNSDRPSQGERPPYRGNSDRPSGGSERPPYRGNSDRPSQGERPPYRGNSDRPSGGSERPPYRGNSDRPSQGERPPYRGNSDRPSGGSDRAPYRGNSERPSSDRPRSDSDSKPWTQRGGSPNRAGAPRVDAGKKLWTRDGAPARNDRDARVVEEEMTEEQRMQRELRSVRPRHDDPELPDDISANDLDRIARNELKTLTKENAETVGRHLAMAARVIDEDPQLAHLHVMSAARRAGRIGVVRESLAITAYATGDFALALRELRTYRRISGSNDQLPLMVDSERGVGRPDRALELGRSVDRATLSPSVQVGLAIAMSGARLDLGETDAALVELEIPQLNPNTAFSYSPELFAAYAEVLTELGRENEADEWLERASRADAALGASGDDDETIEIEEMEEDEDDALASFVAEEENNADDDHAEDVDVVVDVDDNAVAEAADTAETDDETEPDVTSPKA